MSGIPGGHKKRTNRPGNPIRVKQKEIKQTGEDYKNIFENVREEIEKTKGISEREKEILTHYTRTGDVMERLYLVAQIKRGKLKSMLKKNKIFRELFAKIKQIHASFVSSLYWDAVTAREPWALKAYLATHAEDYAKHKSGPAAGFDDFVEKEEREKPMREKDGDN